MCSPCLSLLLLRDAEGPRLLHVPVPVFCTWTFPVLSLSSYSPLHWRFGVPCPWSDLIIYTHNRHRSFLASQHHNTHSNVEGPWDRRVAGRALLSTLGTPRRQVVLCTWQSVGILTVRKWPEQGHPEAPVWDVASGMSDKEKGDSLGPIAGSLVPGGQCASIQCWWVSSVCGRPETFPPDSGTWLVCGFCGPAYLIPDHCLSPLSSLPNNCELIHIFQ